MATLDNVSVDITVVLGTTSMPIHQVLRLGRGAIIELDASEEDEVRILANNMPSTTAMLTETLSSVAKGPPLCGLCFAPIFYGHPMVSRWLTRATT